MSELRPPKARVNSWLELPATPSQRSVFEKHENDHCHVQNRKHKQTRTVRERVAVKLVNDKASEYNHRHGIRDKSTGK